MKVNDAAGVYVCTGCGASLFEAAQGFDAGCGFPSFWQHMKGGVKLKLLTTYGRERTQLLCQSCNQHLGHLFPHKHAPTGLRYCINKASISLNEK